MCVLSHTYNKLYFTYIHKYTFVFADVSLQYTPECEDISGTIILSKDKPKHYILIADFNYT